MPTAQKRNNSPRKSAAKAPDKKKPASLDTITADHVVSELEKHILVDGFKIVIDIHKSRGSRLVDLPTGREFIDLYAFYASQPIGYNHPYLSRPDVEADLLSAAKIKVANADVYSVQY